MNACLCDLAKLVVSAFRQRARRCRRQGALLSDAERRHADGCGLCRALSRADLRERAQPTRSAARRSCRACPTRSSSTSAARPPMSARCTRAFRGRRRSRSKSAACAPTSACPTCSRSASAAARWWLTAPKGVTVGPRSVGYKLVTEALVFGGETLTTTDIAVGRRPHRTRRRLEGRRARQGPDCSHRGAHRRHAGGGRRAFAALARSAAGHRRRRRIDPRQGQDRRARSA